MEIRKFTKSDINAVCSLAERNLIYDKFTYELIFDKSFGDPFYMPQLNLVACEKGNVVGFIIGGFRNYEKGKIGWIKLIAVEEYYRRKNIASELLFNLEAEFKKLECQEIKVMDIPLNYYMPGLDPRYTEAVVFFLRKRFEKIGENINMEADLNKIDYNTWLLESDLDKEGIVIKRAEPIDLNPTLEFIGPIWKLWEYEVKQTFNNNPISLHIAMQRNKVVAFSAYDGNNRGLPWFGPMGTDPGMRGKRIGEILLKRCLVDQKQQGYKYSIIPWAGPISFYLNTVDAKISRVFWTFRKIIKE